MDKKHETPKTTTDSHVPAVKPPSKSSTQTRSTLPYALVPVVLAVVVALGGLAGFGGAWLQDAIEGDNSNTILTTSATDGNSVVTPDEESIAAVAKTVSPSVVSILTTTQQVSRYYNQSYQQEGAGTGMIVSPNGYILTNKHVIDGADSVTVVLPNGKTYDNVEVLGADPLNDVAFLKIKNVNGLPAITFGDSKTVRIGQTVIAIGNALGQYQNTVTSGIISGTGRPVMASTEGSSAGAESLTDLLQTDAAINSGNSGGPLLNLKGQVIGINTAMAQDAQSIGFAIPISATKGLLNHVIKTGKVERAYLGVQYVSINAQVKKQYNLSVDKGDYITADQGRSVQPNGPADKAGIKDGDIIVKVNDYKVGEIASVSSLVSEFEPGDKVVITVLRGGKELSMNVTLGAYQAN